MPASTPHDRLVADCRGAAHGVFAALSRQAGPELLSLELTMGQFKAMATVTMFGPQPVGELGRRLGISEPAASLLVDKLSELGLTIRERDPLDGRRTLVTATPAAIDLSTRLREGRQEHVTRWLAALSAVELEGLASGLKGLLRVSSGLGAAPDGALADAARNDRVPPPSAAPSEEVQHG